jgi:hypothetical protein
MKQLFSSIVIRNLVAKDFWETSEFEDVVAWDSFWDKLLNRIDRVTQYKRLVKNIRTDSDVRCLFSCH